MLRESKTGTVLELSLDLFKFNLSYLYIDHQSRYMTNISEIQIYAIISFFFANAMQIENANISFAFLIWVLIFDNFILMCLQFYNNLLTKFYNNVLTKLYNNVLTKHSCWIRLRPSFYYFMLLFWFENSAGIIKISHKYYFIWSVRLIQLQRWPLNTS